MSINGKREFIQWIKMWPINTMYYSVHRLDFIELFTKLKSMNWHNISQHWSIFEYFLSRSCSFLYFEPHSDTRYIVIVDLISRTINVKFETEYWKVRRVREKWVWNSNTKPKHQHHHHSWSQFSCKIGWYYRFMETMKCFLLCINWIFFFSNELNDTQSRRDRKQTSEMAQPPKAQREWVWTPKRYFRF